MTVSETECSASQSGREQRKEEECCKPKIKVTIESNALDTVVERLNNIAMSRFVSQPQDMLPDQTNTRLSELYENGIGPFGRWPQRRSTTDNSDMRKCRRSATLVRVGDLAGSPRYDTDHRIITDRVRWAHGRYLPDRPHQRNIYGNSISETLPRRLVLGWAAGNIDTVEKICNDYITKRLT